MSLNTATQRQKSQRMLFSQKYSAKCKNFHRKNVSSRDKVRKTHTSSLALAPRVMQTKSTQVFKRIKAMSTTYRDHHSISAQAKETWTECWKLISLQRSQLCSPRQENRPSPMPKLHLMETVDPLGTLERLAAHKESMGFQALRVTNTAKITYLRISQWTRLRTLHLFDKQ